MKKAFTLVELLVVIAVIGILAVVVTAALNPTKRIDEAKTAAMQARVSSAGDEFNLCLNHYDGASATQNGYDKCNDFTKLSSSVTPGGSYIKAVPSDAGWIFQSSASNPTSDGCLYNSVALSDKTLYIQYESLNNSIKNYDAVPACP